MTVVAPAAAAAEAVNVKVLVAGVAVVMEADVGLKLAVTPLGKPLTLNATLPVNPPLGVTVMALVAVPPCATLALVAASLKLDDPVTVKAMVALCVRVPLVPTIEMFVVPVGVLV